MLWSVVGTDRASCGVTHADSHPRRGDFRRRGCSRRRPAVHRHGRARAGSSARSGARGDTDRNGTDCEGADHEDAQPRSAPPSENDPCDRETRAEHARVYGTELHASELRATADRVVVGLRNHAYTYCEAGAEPQAEAETSSRAETEARGHRGGRVDLTKGEAGDSCGCDLDRRSGSPIRDSEGFVDPRRAGTPRARPLERGPAGRR